MMKYADTFTPTAASGDDRRLSFAVKTIDLVTGALHAIGFVENQGPLILDDVGELAVGHGTPRRTQCDDSFITLAQSR